MKAPKRFRIAIGGLLIGVLAAQQVPVAAPPVEVEKAPESEGPARAPEDSPVPASPSSDPFAPNDHFQGQSLGAGIPAERGQQQRVRLRVRLEVWEAPALEVAKRLDSLRDASALVQLREDCLGGRVPAVKLVHSPMLATDVATRMMTEAITEAIYPTEYEPPELPPADAPKTEGTWQRWLELAGKHAVPTSFETRNIGGTFEALVQPVAVEANMWDALISFEHVTQAGWASYGVEELLIRMPVFTNYRTGGLVRLKEGEWRLLSVSEPPRGIEESGQSERRWVALVKIEREP